MAAAAVLIGCDAPARAAGWIAGEGANLNGVVLDDVHVGFGDRLLWAFGNGEEVLSVVSSVDLILGGPSIEVAGSDIARQLDNVRLEHGLQNAKFLMLWMTPQWRPEWFPPAEIQRALDNGITPVFLDWFFGDRLLGADPQELVNNQLDDFAQHSRRLGRYLGQFDGDILVVVEPELNKPAVEAWPEFGLVLREHGIAEIRAGVAEMNQATGRKTTLFFGTTLTDNGLRAADREDDVYGVKSRGDSYGWTLSRPLLEVLRPDLDFIGFQQVISQFHRHHQRPARAVANSPEDLGLADLPMRLVNYSRYLQDQLGLPILIPYVGFPTSSWDDANGDGVYQSHEVKKSGWEREAGGFLADLHDVFPALRDAGVIGVGTMMLFDDPVHDLGGYQYFLDNEYALGLISTDARDGNPGETFGLRLTHKKLGLVSFVELLFQTRQVSWHER